MSAYRIRANSETPSQLDEASVIGLASSERVTSLSEWLKHKFPGMSREQFQVVPPHRFASSVSTYAPGTVVYLDETIDISYWPQDYLDTLADSRIVCHLVRWQRAIGTVCETRRARFGKHIIDAIVPFDLTRRQRLVKRTFDVVASVVALTLASPLMLVIAFLVKADSPGPVIFRQRRLGLDGQEFRIYKFRSLTTMDDGNDIPQVTRDDARVTRVGGWLRRSSMDELPQLINVLHGTMSLVGPRPHAVADDHYYGDKIPHYELRQRAKPGITGWAQIHGARGEIRHLEDMVRRIDLDLDYISRWSLYLDLYICFMTCIKGLFGKHVY